MEAKIGQGAAVLCGRETLANSSACALPSIGDRKPGDARPHSNDRTVSMAINLPANWANSTPKAFYDIFALEGGQKKLPSDARLMGGCAAAYVLAETGLHLLSHGVGASLLYGLASAALLAAATFVVLRAYKQGELVDRTITALTATGVLIAICSILLHFVFAAALPPPLPSARLISFLLFPIAAWKVFAFTYIYRHASLRVVPAFVVAAMLVIAEYWVFASLMK